MNITELKTTFLVKAQVKIADLALFVAQGLGDSFTREQDIENITELQNVVDVMQDDHFSWDDLDTEQVIHYLTTKHRLNDIGVYDLTGKLTNILLGAGGGSADVNALRSYVLNMEIELRTLINACCGSGGGDYTIPDDIMTKINEAYAEKHTHGNKAILDQLTQDMIDAFASMATHIADNDIHITAQERITWNGKVSQQELTNGLAGKANTVHSHPISDVTGLQDALDTLANAQATIPEFSIGSVTLGASPGVSVDNTDPAHPILSFILVKGDQGDPGLDGINGTNGTDGDDGKSAYQIWLDLGNVGTEQDFIDHLKAAGPVSDQAQNNPVGEGFILNKSRHRVESDADFIEVNNQSHGANDIVVIEVATTTLTINNVDMGTTKYVFVGTTVDAQWIQPEIIFSGNTKVTDDIFFEGIKVSGTLEQVMLGNKHITFRSCKCNNLTITHTQSGSGTRTVYVHVNSSDLYGTEFISTSGDISCDFVGRNSGGLATMHNQTSTRVTLNFVGTVFIHTDGTVNYVSSGPGPVFGKYMRYTYHLIDDLPEALSSQNEFQLMGVNNVGSLVKKTINFDNFAEESSQTKYDFTGENPWVVNHNTGSYPVPTIMDTGGTAMIAGIYYATPNQIIITHGGLRSGSVYI